MIKRFASRLCKNRFTMMLLSILVTFCAAAAITSHPIRVTTYTVDKFESFNDANGVYDLRRANMDDQICVLQHTSVYYPNAYLLPDQIEGATPVILDEKRGVTADYLTQRLTILLPEERTYRLKTSAAAARIYINGELYAQNGNPGYSWRDTETRERVIDCYITPVDGKIEVVAHTAVFNLWDDRAGLLPFWVSHPETVYPYPWEENKVTYLVIGALFGASVLLLLMFIARPKAKQNLWFCLACLAIGLRYGGVGQFDELAEVFPFISGNLSFAFECMGFPLMTGFLVLYLNDVYPNVFQGFMKYAIAGISFIYAALIACIDPRIHTWLMQYYQVVMFVAVVWVSYCLIRKLRNPTPEQYVSLYGLILFVLAALYYMLRYNNFDSLWGLPGIDTTEPAMIVLVLAQMLSLFIGNHRAADSAREAERLKALEVTQLERINQLKTEFLANIAHELKTPLTVISGYAQESGKAAHGDLKMERSMKLISSEAERLGLMVSQILDASRVDEGRMSFDIRPCSLTGIVQDTISTFYPVFSKGNNRLTLARDCANPTVLCDPSRVTQVLVNLIANAARHTRDGKIEIALSEKDGFAEVSVADTGAGIPPARMAMLFERYQTQTDKNGRKGNRETGTGLGLYISKHIIEAQGGTIWIESELGKGTTVRFTLPVKS